MGFDDVMMYCALFLVLLCSTTLSAPVAVQDVANDGTKTVESFENQEKELENLIQFAQNQASHSNVQVEKLHKVKAEEINGQKIKDHVMEEKVINQDDGTVIADIRQEVEEVKPADGAQPEAVVETEVSIPSVGVDKTFVQKTDTAAQAPGNAALEPNTAALEPNTAAQEPNNEAQTTDDTDSREEIEPEVDVIIPSVENRADDDEEDDDDDDGDNDDDVNSNDGQVEEEEEEEGEGNEEDQAPVSSIPLTTQDMAEYLYVTQQFDQFLPAIERLVDMQKMTASDAASYAKEVIEQYDRLDTPASVTWYGDYDKRAPQPMYPIDRQPMAAPIPTNAQEFGQPIEVYGFPGYMTPEEQYYLEEMQRQQQQQMPFMSQQQQQQIPFMPQQQQQQMPFMSQQQQPMASIPQQQEVSDVPMADVGQSPDALDVLTVLYDAAYGSENRDAQEIIQLLYDRVSGDDNPDDMAQIRDLLVDTLSTSAYGEGYPIELTNAMSPQAKGDNLLMAPSVSGSEEREEDEEKELEDQMLNQGEQPSMEGIMGDDAQEAEVEDIPQKAVPERVVQVKRSDETVEPVSAEALPVKSVDGKDLEDDLNKVSKENN